MPLAIAPATARSARPKAVLGYVADGWYKETVATRSSVAMAAWALPYTKAISGRLIGTCVLMRIAVDRSAAASAPTLGLANEYCRGSVMAGTATCAVCSTCGVSAVVFHPTSGSTGEGSESRYRPTQPRACVLLGSAVDQMSVPSKCERLWFW